MDDAAKYVRASNGGAFAEIRDNGGTSDLRTWFAQNADTSLGMLFWTGSAYAERVSIDTQNSRIMYGTTKDAHMGRWQRKLWVLVLTRACAGSLHYLNTAVRVGFRQDIR